MLGGELLATGSSSCIFYPNIPCDNEGKRDIHDDKISKVIYHEESEKQSKNEFKTIVLSPSKSNLRHLRI